MRLGKVLRNWRLIADFGVREAAKELGVSPATLSRVERGYAPDAFTLAKILNWLMEKPL